MAKFVTEDGKDAISGDRLMEEYGKQNQSYTDMWFRAHPVKRHQDVPKMKEPHGRYNRDRLLNTNMYDLLAHMQETLSLSNRCVLELITNENHTCLKTNDTILRRIHQFADKHMDEAFIKSTPKIKLHIKVDEDKYDERWETDEEWHDRMCHVYMHRYHPAKLQMIKCEECLQCWMNSDKW